MLAISSIAAAASGALRFRYHHRQGSYAANALIRTPIAGALVLGGKTHQPSSCLKKKIASMPVGCVTSTRT
jgi:hypothetical protein